MNPFRTGQRVTGEFFTDRATEIDAIVRAMRDPGSRLLIYGPRRMGKSSAIAVASERVVADGGLVVEADLSTVSTVTDVANRLLTSLHRSGHAPSSLWELLGSLRLRLEVDQASGMPSVAIEARERSAGAERQLGTLESVLGRLDALAAERAGPVAIVLDEFQEIASVGPERADWWLRSLMQRHSHVSYVCAGSKRAVIERMIDKEGPFYGGFERLYVGPIEADHLAAWIESRMEGAGVPAPEMGAATLALVGPRVEDIMNLARQTYYLAASRGRFAREDPAVALNELVRGEDAVFQALWDGMTGLQQNVLRAIAAGERELHSAGTRETYALGPSSSVTTALSSLEHREVLAREGGEIGFDSPFFRHWVRKRALPDIGR